MPNDPNDMTGLDDSKLYAVLSYLFILVFVPLLTRRNDPFVAFHAKQGLVIFVGYIVAAITAMWVPAIGNFLWLLLMIASIVGVIKAAQGKRWRAPVIAKIADTFTM